MSGSCRWTAGPQIQVHWFWNSMSLHISGEERRILGEEWVHEKTAGRLANEEAEGRELGDVKMTWDAAYKSGEVEHDPKARRSCLHAQAEAHPGEMPGMQ